jgi:hypothetical protein
MRRAAFAICLLVAALPFSASPQTPSHSGIGSYLQGYKPENQTINGISLAQLPCTPAVPTIPSQPYVSPGAGGSAIADMQRRLRDLMTNTAPPVDDVNNASPPAGYGAGGVPYHQRLAQSAPAARWSPIVDEVFRRCRAVELKQQGNSGLAVMCIGAEITRACPDVAECRTAARARVAREFDI